jgi:hypothetical protein
MPDETLQISNVERRVRFVQRQTRRQRLRVAVEPALAVVRRILRRA